MSIIVAGVMALPRLQNTGIHKCIKTRNYTKYLKLKKHNYGIMHHTIMRHMISIGISYIHS